MEAGALLQHDVRYRELRGLLRGGNPLLQCADPLFPANTLAWVGSSLLGTIKGIDAGKVSKDTYLAQAAVHKKPLQRLMPSWNHIEDATATAEDAKPESASQSKAMRAGSRRSSLEK